MSRSASNGLGRSLQRNKKKRLKHIRQMKDHNSIINECALEQCSPHETPQELEFNSKSIVNQDQIDELFDRITIYNENSCYTEQKDFRFSMPFIKCEQEISKNLSKDQEAIDRLNNSVQQFPIRPTWKHSNCTYDKKTLMVIEKESFFTWRKIIHEFQDKEGIVLAPYEKNLNVWRQLWHVIEQSDLICQIVDARDPLLFFCASIKSVLSQYFPNKRMLLILNKADLLTQGQISHWKNYFEKINIEAIFWSTVYSIPVLRENHPSNCDTDNSSLTSISSSSNNAILFDCLRHAEISENNDDTSISVNELGTIKPSHIFTREQLINLFQNHARNSYCKHYTVGMIGFPNVGKSSTINHIMQTKKVAVSSTPGKTKHFQSFILKNGIKLIDCPGLVFPTYANSISHMILAGVLPIDQIKNLTQAVNLMVSRIPQYVFEIVYNITIPTTKDRLKTDYCNAEELLSSFSVTRGLITSCGTANLSEGSKLLLKDYISGKLVYAEPPPGIKTSDYNNYDKFKKMLYKKHCHSKSYNDHIRSKILKMSNMTDEANLEDKFKKNFTKKAFDTLYFEKNKFSSQIDVSDKHWRRKSSRRKGKIRRKYKGLDGTPYDDM